VEFAWSGQVRRLAELLRVPVAEDEDGLRHDHRDQVDRLHATVAALVFSGDAEWFDRDEAEVAGGLGQWLADGQDAELAEHLDSDDDATLFAFLGVLVTGWAARAAAGPEAAGDAADDELAGAENTENWTVNRLPGTYYYAYDGDRYLYSDLPRAPIDEWQPLAVREAQASAAAQPWGAGWCTPAGAEHLYGEPYVFAVDRDGPWLTQPEVESLLTSSAEAPPAEVSQAGGRDEAIRALAEKALAERPELAQIPEERRLGLAAAVVDERWQRTGRWTD
jgi:hypothetical protein